MTFETFLLILLCIDLVATFCFWAENRRLKEENRYHEDNRPEIWSEYFYNRPPTDLDKKHFLCLWLFKEKENYYPYIKSTRYYIQTNLDWKNPKWQEAIFEKPVITPKEQIIDSCLVCGDDTNTHSSLSHGLKLFKKE